MCWVKSRLLLRSAIARSGSRRIICFGSGTGRSVVLMKSKSRSVRLRLHPNTFGSAVVVICTSWHGTVSSTKSVYQPIWRNIRSTTCYGKTALCIWPVSRAIIWSMQKGRYSQPLYQWTAEFRFISCIATVRAAIGCPVTTNCFTGINSSNGR